MEEREQREGRLPNEVVETYRRPRVQRLPGEQVFTYRRPMPLDAELARAVLPVCGQGPNRKPDTPQLRRRRRRGLWIFLACDSASARIRAEPLGPGRHPETWAAGM